MGTEDTAAVWVVEFIAFDKIHPIFLDSRLRCVSKFNVRYPPARHRATRSSV